MMGDFGAVGMDFGGLGVDFGGVGWILKVYGGDLEVWGGFWRCGCEPGTLLSISPGLWGGFCHPLTFCASVSSRFWWLLSPSVSPPVPEITAETKELKLLHPGEKN